MELVGLAEIRQAESSIAGVAVRTPLLRPAGWPRLWLKPENLQPTGAFKLRGALHAVAKLLPTGPIAGVVTHSSGNHGQALAYAAARHGVACVVVMPDVAEPTKVAAVRALGAEVVLVPASERAAASADLAAARGLALVPPYDHADVIAGQGTVGLEIITDAQALGAATCMSAVLVPVGGGGLASGVAAAVKALAPSVAVIGVEPELAADAAASLTAGELVVWPVARTYRTVADGLRTQLSPLTFAHLRTHLAGIVTVTEEEITATVASLARDARIVAEPSGAVAAAAWLHHAGALRSRFDLGDGPVVAIVSGGSIDAQLLARLLA
jgi:threonine dehydratase